MKTTTTYRGIAIAMKTAIDRDELERIAELLLIAASELEMRSDEEIDHGKGKILARRADCLGGLGRAIEDELEVTT